MKINHIKGYTNGSSAPSHRNRWTIRYISFLKLNLGLDPCNNIHYCPVLYKKHKQQWQVYPHLCSLVLQKLLIWHVNSMFNRTILPKMNGGNLLNYLQNIWKLSGHDMSVYVHACDYLVVTWVKWGHWVRFACREHTLLQRYRLLSACL